MRKLSMLGIATLVAITAVSGGVQAEFKSDYNYETKLALDQEIPVEVEKSKKKTNYLALDTTEPTALKSLGEEVHIKIKPGESNAERKVRLEHEAEMKRRAEEAARIAAQRNTGSVKAATYSGACNPNVDKQAVYLQASARFGIPWQILAAVHSAESGNRVCVTATSYAGAQGPFQFMPSTFRAYAVDGDGDGVANIYNFYDAAHTAARYLAANGAGTGPAGVRNALYRYNHAQWYVNKVIGIARTWGYQG